MSDSERQRGPIEKIEQALYLTRFFSKLLGEAVYLKADSIAFKTQGDELGICISAAKQEVKSLSIKKTWFDEIGEWLCNRFISFGSRVDIRVCRPAWPEKILEFPCMVRVGKGLVQFLAKKELLRGGQAALILSDISFLSLTSAYAQLGVADYLQHQLQELLSGERGLVIAAAPDDLNAERTSACLLSFSPAQQLRTDTAASLDINALVQAAEKCLLVVSCRSDDAADALLKVSSTLPQAAWPLLLGVLHQGFIKRICLACARQTAVDGSLLGVLPAGLKPAPESTYLVGRGCDRCGNYGYRGLIGVQSLLLVDGRIRHFLSKPSEQAAMLDYAYQRGCKPLLEDGVRKVVEGKATLEALFDLVRVVPGAYAKFYGVGSVFGRASAAQPGGFGQAAGNAGRPDLGLPAAAEEESAEQETPIIDLTPQRARPLLLVVEDDPDQRAILDMVFKSAGYEVQLAVDGVEALAAVKKDRPDLIILDLMMPRMDGQEFVSRLKVNARFSDIPILVLTVVADADKEYNLLDLGADDYCEKTIQRKVLLKRVDNLLKRRKLE